jgi:hypothetical protein
MKKKNEKEKRKRKNRKNAVLDDEYIWVLYLY